MWKYNETEIITYTVERQRTSFTVHLTTAKQGGECCNQCTVPIYYQSSTSRLWQDLSDPNITVVTQRGPLMHVQ